MSFTPIKTGQLDDPKIEEFRRNIARCLRELQEMPASSTVIIESVSLVDSTATVIPHGLGRVPRIVLVSPPRSATATGRIVETRDNIDRSRAIILTATGHGATITVDIEVK